jgi:hypothetical protein
MAKRFTDTEKYKKEFIKNLPAAYKLFWDYLYHDCTFAGIWYVEMDVAQARIGMDAPVNKDEALSLFNNGEQRIIILNGGKKWFIKPFVDFQYGTLVKTNKLHIGVMRELQKEGVSISLKGRGIDTPCDFSQGVKDKDKEKDKSLGVKGIVKGKSEQFIIAWSAFLEMRKSIRKEAKEHAQKLLLDKLNKLSTDESTQIQIINQSTMNSYQGFWELKGESYGKGKPSRIDPERRKQYENLRVTTIDCDKLRGDAGAGRDTDDVNAESASKIS